MIFSILQTLRDNTSTKFKLSYLEENRDNQLLKDVIYAALSPRVKYYIKKIPLYTTPTDDPEYSLSYALLMLQALSSRSKTGNDAIAHLTDILNNASANDAAVITRIIQKDLKCGINDKTVNKVWEKLLEVTPYMGAVPYNKDTANKLFKDPLGVVSQIKMDGRYANGVVANRTVEFESRSGETNYIQNTFDEILLSSDKDGYALNGEFIIPGYTRYESNGMIASIISIGKKEFNGDDITKERAKFEKENLISLDDALMKIHYVVWDIISYDEYIAQKSSTPYLKRFDELTAFVNGLNNPRIRVVESKPVTSLQEALQDFHENVANNEEGTIIKGLSGKWKNGKPNTQVKVKLEITFDLNIIGYNQGNPGTRLENTLGSLICESEDSLLKTDPAGINDVDRAYIWANKETMINTVAEIVCSGVSKTDTGYSFLHPRFSKLRPDKRSANTLEEILQIEASHKELLT